ncbi:MAG: hypothetical protein M3068_04115 [Gemmatimonadota bacterium]|nr:hypothetical protein [Gemmatimonadota bacterium]
MTTPEQTHEHDGMICRSCGREERASEGYPCQGCGTFLCLICSFRGVTHCSSCAAQQQPEPPAADAT